MIIFFYSNTKSKNKQVGLHQTKKLLHSKGNYERNEKADFPGGTVDRHPPASASDLGSIPAPGRLHMPQSNYACVPQLLSPGAEITEAQAPRGCALQQKKPPQ